MEQAWRSCSMRESRQGLLFSFPTSGSPCISGTSQYSEWLLTLTISASRLRLDDEAVHMAVALRLEVGIDLDKANIC